MGGGELMLSEVERFKPNASCMKGRCLSDENVMCLDVYKTREEGLEICREWHLNSTEVSNGHSWPQTVLTG
jgi:hypothetical protein